MKIITWLKRISLGLLILIVLAALVGLGYEQGLRSKFFKHTQASGQMISLGDYELHAVKKGNGGPTIVFESGLDMGGHLPWGDIQSEIARTHTTLSYDRAGVLWSERGSKEKSIGAMATDLETILEKTNCPKPYILVGHSYAGLTLRKFIHDNQKNIAGLVFVDVSHPEQGERLPKETMETGLPPTWVIHVVNSMGVGRFLFNNTYSHTEPSDSMNIIANNLVHRSLAACLEELDNFESISADANQFQDFGDIPLVVITANADDAYDLMPDEHVRIEMRKVWHELQAELLDLSTTSKHIYADESGHYVQLDQPQLVMDAIREILHETLLAQQE